MFPEDIMKNVPPDRLARIKEMADEVKKVLAEQGNEAANALVMKHLQELFHYHGFELNSSIQEKEEEERKDTADWINDKIGNHLQSIAVDIDTIFKERGKEAAEKFIRSEITKVLAQNGMSDVTINGIEIEHKDNVTLVPPSTTIH